MASVSESVQRLGSRASGWIRLLCVAALVCGAASAPARVSADSQTDIPAGIGSDPPRDDASDAARWSEIRSALYGDRPIQEAGGLIAMETPYRALDAAVVPVDMTAVLEQTPEHFIETLTLIVDNNPAPVAAVFHFRGGRPWTTLSTRVRVDSYTTIRAVAETNRGELFMAANYLKASGGCSAPSLKDPGAAASELGRMKLLLPEQVSPGERIAAQILIKHPNSSGLQFDQVSRHYIPADFVTTIEASYEGELLFSVESNISISEDPSIHFTFIPNDAGTLTVQAKDSHGRTFEQHFEVPTSGGPRS
ncbi:quinoprotein dehydrogenase-associated SoxYZ-like carrier [Thiocapsa rosea]|uniref:Sulfur-oxidizing protein SoxY n=1 Tax=Thiocapsa rosea TaxID=69360 RepID=A0A495VF98_9GAMM|nr:quinoprotein dehydrogenase-associated SoxYZ-like carrier [Thiocapsa rosea]RKT47135.1 sulfur-oxidizing protein SoxY [Thiocapsa rosea]